MDLLRQSGESLAGPIAYLELAQIDALEIEPGDPDKLWVRGGLPDSLLADSDRESRRLRQGDPITAAFSPRQHEIWTPRRIGFM